MEATDKQKEYAKDIAKALGYKLPSDDDKQAYSEYLDKHVAEYKEYMRLLNLDYELQVNLIDARRNW